MCQKVKGKQIGRKRSSEIMKKKRATDENHSLTETYTAARENFEA